MGAEWMAIAAPLIESGVQAASGIFGGISARKDRQQRLYMYEDAKAYNDPANQVNRLRAAGLNPNGNNVSAGQISDSVDLGQSPYEPVMQGINSAVSSYIANLNAKTAKQNADTNWINAQTAHQRALAESRNVDSQINARDANIRYQNALSEFLEQTLPDRVAQESFKRVIAGSDASMHRNHAAWDKLNYNTYYDALLEAIKAGTSYKNYQMEQYLPAVIAHMSNEDAISKMMSEHRLDMDMPFGRKGSEISSIATFANIIIQVLNKIFGD